MAKPFKTLEEIAEYISGDLIQCLECGRWFKHITGKHLHSHELTVEAARKMHRDKHVPAVRERHRDIIKQVRPGDWSLLPAKSNRADGRNADRAREYQRAYRALKSGDPEPMRQYKNKWNGF